MATFSLVVVLGFALWIGGTGSFALVDPERARAAIGLFASSHRINLIEQAARAAAGAALVIRAPASLHPLAFTVAGWAIVVSAAVLTVIPLRWHAGYAQWWSKNLPAWAARGAGAAALLLAAAIAWSALG